MSPFLTFFLPDRVYQGKMGPELRLLLETLVPHRSLLHRHGAGVHDGDVSGRCPAPESATLELVRLFVHPVLRSIRRLFLEPGT